MVARSRTARPAVLSVGVGLAADEIGALHASLLAKSNMDKEKLRGMLEEWDELTSTCDDAVSAVCNKHKIAV